MSEETNFHIALLNIIERQVIKRNTTCEVRNHDMQKALKSAETLSREVII